MYRITKDFGTFPAGHRQPFHEGHCAFIHGHDFRFVVTLTSSVLDENGFVFDFGHFSKIKAWLTDMFDHTLLLQHNDPKKEALEHIGNLGLCDTRWLDSVSAEGLAKMVFLHVSEWLEEQNNQITVESVTVYEDAKNSATYVR